MIKKRISALLCLLASCVCGSCASNGIACDTTTWQGDASQIKIYASASAIEYYSNVRDELFYIRCDDCCIKVKNEGKIKLYSHCTYVIEYKGE